MKKKNLEPENFQPEFTTVWSFPERGNWATHSAGYRGNFAPQIARNIIEFYSKEGDFILDPMVGSGTTLIEAKLLSRNATGYDINPEAVEIAKKSLDFEFSSKALQEVKAGDARYLNEIKDETVDLILTHPPYLNIIKYSDGKIEGDLSNTGSIKKFCDEIKKIALELYRVLKEDKYCAILTGDTRKGKHFIPLAFRVMEKFLDAGFALKEDIIKVQHNCRMTGYWRWRSKKENFYLIMHEHLFVFRKPKKEEDLKRIKWSVDSC